MEPFLYSRSLVNKKFNSLFLYSQTPSFYDRMGSSQLTHHSVLDHSDGILEMKARQLLPSDDLHAFEFYLDEYRANRLSLTSFLTVLSDLLNTPEKVLCIFTTYEFIFSWSFNCDFAWLCFYIYSLVCRFLSVCSTFLFTLLYLCRVRFSEKFV